MDSSSYQRFSKSVGRYQGLRPHSDEYKTLEKSWLSYVCHERSVAGILESPLPVVGHAKAVLELAPSLQTASSERIDSCLAPVARAERHIPVGLPHVMKRHSTNCAVSRRRTLHLAHGWQNFLWREQCRAESGAPERNIRY
jgi:hypothetical protein